MSFTRRDNKIISDITSGVNSTFNVGLTEEATRSFVVLSELPESELSQPLPPTAAPKKRATKTKPNNIKCKAIQKMGQHRGEVCGKSAQEFDANGNPFKEGEEVCVRHINFFNAPEEGKTVGRKATNASKVTRTDTTTVFTNLTKTIDILDNRDKFVGSTPLYNPVKDKRNLMKIDGYLEFYEQATGLVFREKGDTHICYGKYHEDVNGKAVLPLDEKAISVCKARGNEYEVDENPGITSEVTGEIIRFQKPVTITPKDEFPMRNTSFSSFGTGNFGTSGMMASGLNRSIANMSGSIVKSPLRPEISVNVMNGTNVMNQSPVITNSLVRSPLRSGVSSVPSQSMSSSFNTARMSVPESPSIVRSPVRTSLSSSIRSSPNARFTPPTSFGGGSFGPGFTPSSGFSGNASFGSFGGSFQSKGFNTGN